MSAVKTVAIIGAGPVGLAAAAHVLERGLNPVVLEAGAEVAHAVRQWGHVQLFSPWKYNIDSAAERLLVAEGWSPPAPEQYPTGAELIETYLEPLATRTRLRSHIRTSSRVTSISRIGFDKLKTAGREQAPFEIRYQGSLGFTTERADAVIDVSGTWLSPNPAGINGLPAIGEGENAGRIAYGMPDVLGKDRARYAGKAVAVLGAGHSAIGTLLDLAKLKADAHDTEVIWILRGIDPAKAYGGGSNDKLVARGELGSAFRALVGSGDVRVEAGFATSHLTLVGNLLRIGTGSSCCAKNIVADELVVATGFRPDLSFLSELRLQLDPTIECPIALAPLIDPNEHGCGTIRPHGARELKQSESGFYFAGMKSYGRAPTFLMLTGYEQIRSIVAEIAGDHEAAERVELELPETGVCSRPIVETDVSASGCCGPVAKVATACCGAEAAPEHDEQKRLWELVTSATKS
jgi:pyridine nucleotide-disulfide oxidoreductase